MRRSGARLLGRLASSPLARPLRALANALLGGGLNVAYVRSGPARGMRMELDLSREKAYWLGHYEPEVQEALRKAVRSGMVVYDVGAHIGFFSLCAAALGGRVVAFEPDPENAARLRRNVELNGVDVEVVEAAVWDSEGEVALGGSSARELRAGPGRGVQAIALSSFTAGRPNPAVIKIDVEGAEGNVLQGAAALLAEARPTVICEIHGEAAEREVREALAAYRLVELGSRWRVLARPD